MSAKYAGVVAVKSAKRKRFVDGIVDALTTARLYKGLTSSVSEETFVYKLESTLERKLEKLFLAERPDNSVEWAANKAESSLVWERNTYHTVNHTLLMGTQHRPDMYVDHGDYKVAIEFKRVSNGDSVRAAIGQGIVYSSEYEFTVLLLLDVTRDKKVYRAFKNAGEDSSSRDSVLICELWDEFGVKMVVVAPK